MIRGHSDPITGASGRMIPWSRSRNSDVGNGSFSRSTDSVPLSQTYESLSEFVEPDDSAIRITPVNSAYAPASLPKRPMSFVASTKSATETENDDDLPLLNRVSPASSEGSSYKDVDEVEQKWSELEKTLDEEDIASVVRSIKDITAYDFEDLVRALEYSQNTIKPSKQEARQSFSKLEIDPKGSLCNKSVPVPVPVPVPPKEEEIDEPPSPVRLQAVFVEESREPQVPVVEAPRAIMPLIAAPEPPPQKSRSRPWNPIWRRRSKPQIANVDDADDDKIGLLNLSRRASRPELKLFQREHRSKPNSWKKPSFRYSKRKEYLAANSEPTRIDSEPTRFERVKRHELSTISFEEDDDDSFREEEEEGGAFEEMREEHQCDNCSATESVENFNFDVWGLGGKDNGEEEEDSLAESSTLDEEEDHEADDRENIDDVDGHHVLGIIAPNYLNEDIDNGALDEMKDQAGGIPKMNDATSPPATSDAASVSSFVDEGAHVSKENDDPASWGCRMGVSISEVMSSYTAGLCSSEEGKKAITHANVRLEKKRMYEHALFDAATVDSDNGGSGRLEASVKRSSSRSNQDHSYHDVLQSQHETIEFGEQQNITPLIRPFSAEASNGDQNYEDLIDAIPMAGPPGSLTTISQPFVSEDLRRSSPSYGRRAFSPVHRPVGELVSPSQLMQGKPPKPSSHSPKRSY